MNSSSYSRWLSRRIFKKVAKHTSKTAFWSRNGLELLEDRSVPAVISITPNPTGLIPLEGQPSGIASPIGTFVVDNFIGADQSSQLSAEVLWGDGVVSGGVAGPTIVFNQNLGAGRASYNVFASHIYTTASVPSNPYTLTVRVYDNTPPNGSTASNSGFLTVRDNPLTAQTNPTVTATVGAPLTNVVVARFTDANPFSTPDQLRATINWSNPSRTQAGTIVRDSNGVYSVLGSQTYDASAAAGPSSITVSVVSQDPGFGITINNTATVNQAAIVPVANPVSIIEGATTIPAGMAVGSFTDLGGGQPAANYTNLATFALFPGALGTTPLTVVRNGTSNTYTLTTAAVTNLVSPARIGVSAYSIQVLDGTGNLGRTTGSLTVNNAPLTVLTVSTVNPPTEGQPITVAPLFTFNDANPSATAAEYSARINWGDDTPDSVGTVSAISPGNFQVAGTHTYTRRTGAAVTRRVTITVTDAGGQSISGTTGTFNVLDALLSSPAGIPVVGAAGQALVNVPVATFVDANPFAVASDYTASVNWGVGGPPATTGYIQLVGRTAAGTLFSVTSTTLFPSVVGSPFLFQVTITDIGGQVLQPTSTATITQSSIPVSVFAQNGSVGTPLVPSAPLALFTDTNGAAAPGAYTATVNWGDGSAPVTFAAGAGISLVSGNQLRFVAPAGRTYTRPGIFSISVTIAGPDGRAGVGSSSALIAAPAFSGVAGGPNIVTAVEGTALPATTRVAVFTIADPAAVASGYTADIDWGDGTPQSIGVISQTGANATSVTFQVTAAHTYTRYNAGPVTIRVNVADAFGTTVNATTTVNVVADAVLSGAIPVPIVGAAGQQLVNVPIGTFVDANPFATAADHAVTVTWGDGGPASIGTVTLVGRNGTSSVFAISGNRVYSSVTGSPFTVTAVVTDAGGSSVTVNTTATITQSSIAVSVFAQNGSAGLPLVASVPFALFTDSNGAAAPGAYTATVNWGDGTAPVTFPAGAGIALVSGNQLRFTVPASNTYARPSLYPITVTIAGPDGRVGVGGSSALIAAPVFSGVAGGPNITTAVEGTALPGSTSVAVFTVANPSATAAGYTATIDWGDGTPFSLGVVAPTGTTATTASFRITGAHTYTRYNAGPLTVRVNITDAFGTTVNATTTVTAVADAPLSGPAPLAIVGAAGQLLVDVPLGTFVDANPFATPADHAVTISWGDGNPNTVGLVSLVGRNGTGSVFAISGSRVFPSVTGSPFAISAVVTDAGGSTVTVNTTATITQSPIAVSVFAQNGSAGLALVLTPTFALFTDANGAAAPGAYTATINWGDGSAPVTFAAGAGISLVSGNQLRFVAPAGRTYARPGLYPITVTIAGPDGRVGVGASSALITAPVLSGVAGGPNITTAVEGTALPATTPVAVFTVGDPTATAAGYAATIDWGDGSPMSFGAIALTGTTATTASFQVTGGHTYTRYNAGPLTIRVNITDGYGTTVSAATTVTRVADAALSGPLPLAVVGVAGQLLIDVPLGTFVDANPFATPADHAVTISWGDGNPNTVGLVSLVGRNGTSSVFAISGSRVFPSVIGSPFAISAVVTDAGGSTVTVSTTATITQSPIAVSVFAQNGSAGLALVLTPTFALFTDANGAAAPGAYTATINWGDGSAPVTFAAGAGISLVSGNQLRFVAPAGRTYARPGLYPITVTIAGPDGRVGVGASSALVVPPGYPGGFVPGANINRVEGSAVPANTVLTTFTVANPAAISSGYTATIDWGDGLPRSTGAIALTGVTATTASFRITGGHTYSRPGTYTVTVTVADEFGTGGVATLPAAITNAPLINPQGIPILGTARVPLVNVALGFFTDTNPLGAASEYTAAINWNDPLAPGADPVGFVSLIGGITNAVQFGIAGSHTYTRAGTYAVTVLLTDASGQTVTVNTSVIVRAPIISGGVNPVIVTEGAPTVANLVIASFASLGSNVAADYTVTVGWGDGTSNATGGGGVTVVATGGGNFNVLAPAHTYAIRGSYVLTVTVSGIDGSGPISLTNLATVLDAPLTGTNGAVTIGEGATYTATPAAPLVTFTDANPGGNAAEFLATIDWGDGFSGIGAVVQPGGPGTAFRILASHTYDDNRVYNSTVVITSSGGQRAIIPATFTVTNVAPRAQIVNSGPVFENTPVTVALNNAYDPSPADTAAGIRYSFALTPGGLAGNFQAAGLSNSAQFTFPDGPSTQTVWGRVIDKDGGFTDYQTAVTVVNVAPTATPSVTGSRLPRQPITVTLSNAADASPVDTAAGFTYSFDLGNGAFTAPTANSSIAFTPPVAGTLTIRGRVFDKDGGFSEYTFGSGANGTAGANGANGANGAGGAGGAGGLVVREQTIYAIGAGNGGSPIVKVYNPIGTLVTSFFAYDPTFRGGVNVAVGDVNGDGIPDIITGTGAGGGPHVKVFDGRDFSQIANFMATNPDFRGGIHVATGDVDGDGIADVITGAGDSGGPQVQVFRGGDFAMIRNFFAYDSSFRGGVNVSAADVDGDGFAEIITGAGNGGAPHVKVFDGRTLETLRSFFAYESTFTGGVTVAAGDINRDGRVEIVTGPGIGGGSVLRSFDALTGDPGLSVFAFGPDRVNGKPLRNGINVAVTGFTAARGPVVVVGSGPDYAPLVTIRDGRTLDELNTIFPFEDNFAGGVFVG